MELKLNLDSFLNKEKKIAIIGLGYVGLPLAVLMDKKYSVVGFDINEKRINDLKNYSDATREVTSKELQQAKIEFTNNPEVIKQCDLVVVTVPTPIDSFKRPDLTPIKSATKTVGRNLKKGSVVVYESTVYPGLTEEECVPILENESGYKWKTDFNVGYSPERVNPGDKNRTIDKIVKVVAGDTLETGKLLCDIYGQIITEGIHPAPNIKTAEAAKVIENTQRDLNIALMNELATIFHSMNIETHEVLKAAQTKWNFLPFYPGLVGGHCIGVDPYYLTFKAENLGHRPEVILSGRRINDNMGKYIAQQTVKAIVRSGKVIQGNKILICGFTFKENIPDLRNTKVIDIYNELKDFGVEPVIYDPMVSKEEMKHEYQINVENELPKDNNFLAVILAVKHTQFETELDYKTCCQLQQGRPVVYDVKGIWENTKNNLSEIEYMRL